MFKNEVSMSIDEQIREQAQRLFAQRVYFVAHITVFLTLLILSEGRIARLGVIFAAWAMMVLGHIVFLALYENREAIIRQSYEKRKREQETHNFAPDDVFYEIGSDGELIPEEDENSQRQQRR